MKAFLAEDPDQPIGRDRTKSPFDVVDAFNGLSGTIDQLDTTTLIYPGDTARVDGARNLIIELATP